MSECPHEAVEPLQSLTAERVLIRCLACGDKGVWLRDEREEDWAINDPAGTVIRRIFHWPTELKAGS